MIKQVLHKTTSILMAFVVLFSTMSFTIDMHYCGETLVETAIFHKAKGCGMEMQNPSIEGCAFTKKNCCRDEQFIFDGQDELQLSVEKVCFEQQEFIVPFIYTYIHFSEGFQERLTSYSYYNPPLVIRQLYKIDETYLI